MFYRPKSNKIVKFVKTNLGTDFSGSTEYRYLFINTDGFIFGMNISLNSEGKVNNLNIDNHIYVFPDLINKKVEPKDFELETYARITASFNDYSVNSIPPSKRILFSEKYGGKALDYVQVNFDDKNSVIKPLSKDEYKELEYKFNTYKKGIEEKIENLKYLDEKDNFKLKVQTAEDEEEADSIFEMAKEEDDRQKNIFERLVARKSKVLEFLEANKSLFTTDKYEEILGELNNSRSIRTVNDIEDRISTMSYIREQINDEIIPEIQKLTNLNEDEKNEFIRRLNEKNISSIYFAEDILDEARNKNK
ncbi:UNVERIFIED_CONTAM: hypothetical protein O8I53_06335 [Campylobacter lari]